MIIELLHPKFRKGEICMENHIYQLSNDPDFNTNEGEINYIGYERIGEFYSGKSKVLEDSDLIRGEKISEMIGNGILLDLACGDGLFTVPIAKKGTKIVAGDISNNMLRILQKRAQINNISLDCVELCRINALDLPFADHVFDFVIANSFLHLISKPEIALKEIYRVLKKGGKLLCFDDAPNQEVKNSVISEEDEEENKKCQFIISTFDARYFEILRNEYGLKKSMYSWKFNRDELCKDLFSSNEEQMIYTVEKKMMITLEDGYLYRLDGKGYSAQSLIPDEIHEIVFHKVLNEFIDRYGEEMYHYKYTYTFSGAYNCISYIK